MCPSFSNRFLTILLFTGSSSATRTLRFSAVGLPCSSVSADAMFPVPVSFPAALDPGAEGVPVNSCNLAEVKGSSRGIGVVPSSGTFTARKGRLEPITFCFPGLLDSV